MSAGSARARLTLAVLSAGLAACIPGGAARQPAAAPVPIATQSAPVPQPDPAEQVATLPAPPPAWEVRPVTAAPQQVAATSYLVRPGDTLGRIADRTGAGAEAIARANRLTAPFAIRTGQRLTIPGGRFHQVRAGETGIAIARAYGLDWSRLVAINHLQPPYALRTGMRIQLPDLVTVAAMSARERAAAFTLDVGDIVAGSEPALAADAEPARPRTAPGRAPAPTTPVAAPQMLSGGFIWPVNGKVVRHFGASGESGDRSDGIKIAVPAQTRIVAAADGVVGYAGEGVPALGGLVLLKHGDGWTTIYGHASQLLVQRGQAVKRGQVIALSGETGFAADQPEVHFELRRGLTPVDPLARLPAR